jgi:hypothetical protein
LGSGEFTIKPLECLMEGVNAYVVLVAHGMPVSCWMR